MSRSHCTIEGTPVIMDGTIERALASCLADALASGADRRTRTAAAKRSLLWNKGLNAAAKEMIDLVLSGRVPPDPDTPRSSSRPARSRGRRAIGGRSRTSSPLTFIPRVSAEDPELPPAFRMACLLLRTAWNCGDDDDQLSLVSLRSSCDSGINPVWHALADQCDALKPMKAHPTSVQEDLPATQFESSIWQIDPLDLSAVAHMLSTLPSEVLSDEQIGVSRSLSQQESPSLEAFRTVVGNTSFHLPDDASIIDHIVRIAKQGDDIDVILTNLSELESEDALDLHALTSIRAGHVDGIERCLSDGGNRPLSEAMRTAALQSPHLPNDALNHNEMLAAYDHLISQNSDSESIDRIRWWALNSESINEESISHLLSSIDPTTITEAGIATLLQRAKDGSPTSLSLVQALIERADVSILHSILSDDAAPDELQHRVALLLVNHLPLEDQALDSLILTKLFTHHEIEAAAEALMRIPESSSNHPYLTLLVNHLHSAEPEGPSVTHRIIARLDAIKVLREVENVPLPSPVTTTAARLLATLDGAEDPALGDNEAEHRLGLNVNGYMAFKRCRAALSEQGDGNVSVQVIQVLEDAVSEADLTPLEQDLFNVLITTLLTSRASSLLRDPSRERHREAGELAENVLSRTPIRGRILASIVSLVREHSISVPSLVEWFRDNDPSNRSHWVVRAGVLSLQGDHISAANQLRRAAEHESTEFDERISLLRTSVIEYARAGQFNHALSLVQQYPALEDNLASDFVLYLRVSDDMIRDAADSASNRLLEAVTIEQAETRFDEEGNEVSEIVSLPSPDALEELIDYPNRHRWPLPAENFSGRVRSVLRRIRSKRTKKGHRRSSEQQIKQAIEARDLESITHLAERLCSDSPHLALLTIERALKGRWNSDGRTSLVAYERSIYHRYNKHITIQDRTRLRHLSLRPLILIDTNLLVDCLRDEITRTYGIGFGLTHDVSGERTLARAIRSAIQREEIIGWVPEVVKGEMEKWRKPAQVRQHLLADAYARPSTLSQIDSDLDDLVDQTLATFGTWSSDFTITPSEAETTAESVDTLLLNHRSTYQEIDHGKRRHGHVGRTELGGEEIYPEGPDIEIMNLASALASSTDYKDIGMVAVATRDTDFTMLKRTFESSLGFSVLGDAEDLRRILGIDIPTS